MKLYKAQMMLLLSKKDVNILMSSLLMLIIYLVYSSGYYMDYNYQIVNRDGLFYQYLIDSVSFMKFTIIVYGIYFSILSKKLHYLDGLLLCRGSKTVVIMTRLIVLATVMMLMNTIQFVLFVTIGDFLTPIMMSYDYIELFISMQLFGLYYFFLSYIISIYIRVFYAPLFVLFFYFVGSIFSPYYATISNVTMVEKIIAFFSNDLIVFYDHSISPFYGLYHVGLMISLLVGMILYLYHKNDIIIF